MLKSVPKNFKNDLLFKIIHSQAKDRNVFIAIIEMHF